MRAPLLLRRWLLALLLVSTASGCQRLQELFAPQAPEKARARGVVDVHLHISPSEIERAVKLMDEQGIAYGLNLSGTWPGAILEKQLALAEESGRLLVAANVPWAAARRFEDFPERAAELLRKSHELGARALKVEKALGLSVRSPSGELLAVDDPWLDPIWRTAGELGLPVFIHTADPKAFWLPVDDKNERFEELSAHPGWSNHERPVPTFEALLEQMLALVARHRGTTFVAVHFGNHAEDPFWVGRALEAHPNLYVDLAARVPELGRHDAKRMHELFLRHQDRILFGTDTGLGPQDFYMLGSFGETPNRAEEVGPYFRAHWRWLETWDPKQPSPTPIQGRWTIDGIGLPADVLEKVYRTNAERLLGRPGDRRPAPPTPSP